MSRASYRFDHASMLIVVRRPLAATTSSPAMKGNRERDGRRTKRRGRKIGIMKSEGRATSSTRRGERFRLLSPLFRKNDRIVRQTRNLPAIREDSDLSTGHRYGECGRMTHGRLEDSLNLLELSLRGKKARRLIRAKIRVKFRDEFAKHYRMLQ